MQRQKQILHLPPAQRSKSDFVHPVRIFRAGWAGVLDKLPNQNVLPC